MIVVTGATGKLGQHVVDQLLKKVPASQVAVAVRNTDKAKPFAARGVEVRFADYEKPASLDSALRGATKVLLISSNEVGQRLAQHRAVIAAAKRAEVSLLAYTSILHADRSKVSLAVEHKATEEAIVASRVPYVFLRNGWYIENYSENLAPVLEHGVFLGSAGEGRQAAATRADFAAAAVTVLTTPGHANKTYELAADESFTMAQLAAEVSRQTGKTIAYNDLPQADYKAALLGAGLPEAFAEILSDASAGVARGELDDKSGDLQRLIDRATTPLAEAIRQALSGPR